MTTQEQKPQNKIVKSLLYIGMGHDRKCKLFVYREVEAGKFQLLEKFNVSHYDYETYQMIGIPDHSTAKKIGYETITTS